MPASIASRFSTEELNEMIHLYEKEAFSPSKIGNRYGVDGRTIRKALTKAGVILSGPTKYRANHRLFDTWSDEMAYILGFFITDGSMEKNSNSIRFVVKRDDIEILEYIQKIICPQMPIRHCSQVDKRTLKTYHAVCYKISSLRIANFLRNDYHTGPCKTGFENLDFDVPNRYISSLCRGILDGDGTVSRQDNTYPEFSIISASERFLKQIKELCGGIGWEVRRDRGDYKIPMFIWGGGADSMFQFRDIIYPTGNEFGLQRKKDRFFSFTRKA